MGLHLCCLVSVSVYISYNDILKWIDEKGSVFFQGLEFLLQRISKFNYLHKHGQTVSIARIMKLKVAAMNLIFTLQSVSNHHDI